tara:strand:+ start:363 stop:668 length:306 start_codon:yes stop_codon:yes gene_type:complete
MAIYTNITTSPATTTLIAKDTTKGISISKITIANFSDNTADAIVNVYLNDGSATDLYLCKNVAIPKGVTLVLDDNVSFNRKKYDLKMYSTGTAPALTVIIK